MTTENTKNEAVIPSFSMLSKLLEIQYFEEKNQIFDIDI